MPFIEDEEPHRPEEEAKEGDAEQPAKKKTKREQMKADKRDAAKKKRASAKEAKREELAAHEAKETKTAPPAEPDFDGERVHQSITQISHPLSLKDARVVPRQPRHQHSTPSNSPAYAAREQHHHTHSNPERIPQIIHDQEGRHRCC